MKLNRPIVSSLFMVFLITSALEKVLADSSTEGQFLGAIDTEYPDWFKQSFLDLREDISEAVANNKRVILLFYQDGCPYCNALVERNLSQQQIESKIRKNFDVIAINMWGDREVTGSDGKQYTEKSFAESLKVQFTPTILFYNEHGDTILRLNGYRSPHRFNIDLDYVINHVEQQLSYHDYIQQNLIGRKSVASQLISEPYLRQSNIDLQNRNPEKPFAVIFEQKDCPNCEVLHQKVLPDEELQRIISEFDMYQLDMWSPAHIVIPDGRKLSARDWAKELQIQYAPSIVLFNADAEEVIRTEAYFKVFHTRGVFKYVISGGYLQQPSFQRFLSEYADSVRLHGEDVNIWQFADEQD